MGKSFRLPNGYGSIYKLSGNRRRPYAVAKTFGWDEKGKQLKKIIGYATTKKEGLEMLLEYNKDPYDIDHKKITVDYVYNLTIEKIQKMVDDEKMSKSNCNRFKSVYKNHCQTVAKRNIMDLTYKEMQDTLDNCPFAQTTKGYIKTLYIKMFEYAKLELGIKLDLDFPNKLETGKRTKSDMHKSFSESDFDKVWNLYQSMPENDLEVVLIMLYTGLRPQELIDIETSNINISEDYMIGGCKTEAGKNRIIPVHRKIKSFIQKRMNQKYLIMINDRKATYDDISQLWKKIMNKLEFDYLPYDARHTMATRLDDYKITHPNSLIDDLTIKLIMGHAITDITQKVYTHRQAKYLVEAINLLY